MRQDLLRFRTLVLMPIFLAAGCGGGGEGGDPIVGTPTPTPSPTSTPVGQAPNAGPDKTVTLPDTRVALEGTPAGTSVAWSVVSGPGPVTFENAASATSRVAAYRPGTYVLRVTARDSAGNTTGSDEATLTVSPNPVQITSASTPLDHLRAIDRPAFKSGHSLLPLTTSSCAISPDIQLELVRHWGYAGQFSTSTDLVNDPVVREVRTNPGRYPVALSIASLYPIFENYTGARTDLPRLPASTWIRNASGTIVLQGGKPIVSPLAPDSAMDQVGALLGTQARAIEDAVGQPIRIAVNNGEYGLWVPGDNDPEQLWGQDPAVLADYRASGFANWFDYFSARKARQEARIKEEMFRALARGRPVYSWYQESYGPERGRWAGWPWFTFRWEQYLDANGRPRVSDYSSPQMYYNFANSGWTGIQGQQGIAWDALTQALKDAGGVVALGQRNIYPWVSQGWDGGDSGGISDDDLFLGAMKAYYTAGAIGAVSGYFTCTGTPFEAMRQNRPVGTATPTQIRNLFLLGQAHALFSHLEPYLRQGDLLPGTDAHPYQSFAARTPAMEFNPVGEISQVAGPFGAVPVRTARVLARKLQGQDKWLVTAWANTGNDRDIRVTIDTRLGELTLRARRAGSVYLVALQNGAPVLDLVDDDAMNPTRTLFQ